MVKHIGRNITRLQALGLQDLLLAQIYPIVSSVLITFVTARVLGPEGRGALAFVTATCSLAGAVLFFSLHVGGTELHSRGQPGLTAAVRWAGMINASVVGLVAALRLFNLVDTQTLWLAAGSALVAINLVILRCIQAVGRDAEFRRAWSIQSLGYATLGIPLALLVQDWRWVLAAWALTLTTSTYYGLRIFRQVSIPGRVDRSQYIRTVRSSSMAHLGTIGIQILYRADLVVLGIVSTKTQVGLYSIAVTATGFVWNLAEAFSLKAFQRHGKAPTARDDVRLLKFNAVLSSAVGILICAISAIALPIALPRYTPSVPLVLILMIGVVAQGPSRVAMSMMQRRENYGIVMVIGLAAVACSAAYIPIASRWQAKGLAWASTLAYVAMALLVFAAWRATTNMSHKKRTATPSSMAYESETPA